MEPLIDRLRCLALLACLSPSAYAFQFRGEYFVGENFETRALVRYDDLIDFDWSSGTIDPSVGADHVSIRWTGQVHPAYEEAYTFHAVTNDGVRLWVDGVLLIDDWTQHPVAETTGRIRLGPGGHDVVMEYFDSVGSAVARLDWSSPSQARVPVTSQLSGLDSLEAFPAFLGGAFPNTTPGVSNVVAHAASPNLGIETIMATAVSPDGNTIYVASREGEIVAVAPGQTMSSGTLFLDITGRVWTGQDSGLLGIALHPEFGQVGSPNRGYLYLVYIHALGNATYLRLSRFTVPSGSTVASPGSEQILIQQALGPTLHRGGGLLFGEDEFLYLSVGDLGWPQESQSIDGKFNSCVLRIDVDQDLSRSHPITTSLLPNDPTSFSGHYTIPNDNPFVGAGSGVLEEYFALGLRNPHRMTFDPVSDLIHIGDVGSNGANSHEEINVLQAGGNYGWPFRESNTNLANPPAVIVGQLVDPVSSYPRGPDGACVIGGYVYRGSTFPWLNGRYVYADWVSRRIWAAQDELGNGPKELLCMAPVAPVTFGVEPGGELFIAGGDSVIYRLGPGTSTPEPPALLSQTGVFANLQSLDPVSGFVPYDVQTPLWSDGAKKKRWLAVPNDGTADTAAEKIAFSPGEPWGFPIGSILVKHFDLPLTGGGVRKLETRFLVHGNDGEYYGVTYKWRPDQTDAELLLASEEEIIDGQTWTYPGRDDCMDCHNTPAGSVLGPRTAQLNGELRYTQTGRFAQQIQTLDLLGLLEPSALPEDLHELPRMAGVKDKGAFLTTRVRSYLQANCAQCHMPGGPGRGVFDARFTTPFAEQNLINGDVAETYGVSEARVVVPQDVGRSILHRRFDTLSLGAMPPLGRNVLDESGTALFVAWIAAVNEPGGRFSGSYYTGQSFDQLVLQRADARIDFEWGSGAPDPQLGTNNFSVIWSGTIVPAFTETYTFHATTDDGVRLYVDGSLVASDWTPHPASETTGTVNLVAGQSYALVMEYFESTGGASARLEWSSPSQERELVQAALTSNTAPTANGQMLQVALGTPLDIQLTGSDAEHVGLDVAIRRFPAGGTLSGFGRHLVYQPFPGFSGVDSFTFVLSDGALVSTEALVTIEVGCAGCADVGTPFCPGNANSASTSGAELLATGSVSVSDANLTLVARDLPPGTSGLFFFGLGQTSVPLGAGTLCVGGGQFRLYPMAPSSPTGVATRTLNFGAAPVSTTLLPGTTRYFQHWYRDGAVGPGVFNLSNGLQLTFE